MKKLNVKDRLVQFANRYRLSKAENGEDFGTFDFNEATGTVTEEGTEINKELFDKIDANFDELDKGIKAETSRATAAESTLTTRIAAEETAREQAVTAEKDRAQTEEQRLSAAISKETADREAAVNNAQSTLEAAIEAEQTRATTAESALDKKIAAETTAREQAVSDEAARATAAEKKNADAIAAETSAREAAITKEIADRNAAIKVETDRAKAAEAQLESKKVNLSGGELKDTVVTFPDYTTNDNNIASGETTATLFGKIKKWFGRLKALAFKATVATADIDNGAVTSAKIADKTIVNGDISDTAAIAQSKIDGLPKSLTDIGDRITNLTFNDLKRVQAKAYTGGSEQWYYPIAKILAYDNKGNYASVIITGRIGGWVKSNMSYINAVLSNRDGETGSIIDLGDNTAGALGVTDIVTYRQTDGSAIVYLKCSQYHAFDLNMQVIQAEYTFDGSHVTAPTGELKWSASTATNSLFVNTNGGYIKDKKIATEQWVNDQKFTNIADGAITKQKLDSSLQGSIDKADGAMPKSGGTFTGRVSFNADSLPINNNPQYYATVDNYATGYADTATMKDKLGINAAQKAADNAASAAATAQDTADLALDEAGDAASNAQTALATAQNAEATANAASVTAAAAKTAANNAMPKSGGTFTGNVSFKYGINYIGADNDSAPTNLLSIDKNLDVKASTIADVKKQFNLSNVATSGSYKDLIDKPKIPSTYTLPQATSTTLGGIKLGSSTTQTASVNTATSTSGRTYPVQVNSSGQGVVNVPWTDTKYTLPAATSSALGGVYLLLSSGAENMILGFGAKNPNDSSSEWFHIDTAKILISGITNQVINFKTAFKKVPMVLINAVGTAGNEQTWAQAQKITNVTTSSFTVAKYWSETGYISYIAIGVY